jgi:hypothetical protein
MLNYVLLLTKSVKLHRIFTARPGPKNSVFGPFSIRFRSDADLVLRPSLAVEHRRAYGQGLHRVDNGGQLFAPVVTAARE